LAGGIFISYRREDSAAYAGRLYDRLSAHFGRERVFMDIDTIQPGDDFIDVLETTVAQCDVLIAIVGKYWLTVSDHEGKRRIDHPEDFVHLEVAAALNRNVRVIPALVAGSVMPSSAELPDDIRMFARRNAISLLDHTFHQAADKLIEVCDLSVKKGEEKRDQATRFASAPSSSTPEQQGPAPVSKPLSSSSGNPMLAAENSTAADEQRDDATVDQSTATGEIDWRHLWISFAIAAGLVAMVGLLFAIKSS
jgi:hypothetical protein